MRQASGMVARLVPWEGARVDGVIAVLARGSLGSFSVKFLNHAVAFLVQILLARMLGAKSYGTYVYALSWVNLLLLVSSLGFDAASLRFVAEYSGLRQWDLLHGFLRSSGRSVILASLISAVVACLSVLVLSDRIERELFYTFILGFALLPFLAIQQIRSYGLQALKRIILAEGPRDVIRPIILGGCAWTLIAVFGRGATAPTAMAANLVAVASATGLTLYLFRRVIPPLPDASQPALDTGTWWGVAWPLLLIAGLHLVLSRIDMLLIGMLLDTEAAGVYAAATRIAALVLFGYGAVNAIVAPIIAEMYAQGETSRLQGVLRLSALGVLVFSLPLAVGIIVMGHWLLGFFGPDFDRGFTVLVILALAQLASVLAGPVGFLLTMTGHQRNAAVVAGGCALLNVVLNLALIPTWGITGAAVATATVVFVWNAWLSYVAWTRLRLRGTVF
jgi:O-antigen/teichoic acid export membrane protein